jgi:hypothetical protein
MAFPKKPMKKAPPKGKPADKGKKLPPWMKPGKGGKGGGKMKDC